MLHIQMNIPQGHDHMNLTSCGLINHKITITIKGGNPYFNNIILSESFLEQNQFCIICLNVSQMKQIQF